MMRKSDVEGEDADTALHTKAWQIAEDIGTRAALVVMTAWDDDAKKVRIDGWDEAAKAVPDVFGDLPELLSEWRAVNRRLRLDEGGNVVRLFPRPRSPT